MALQGIWGGGVCAMNRKMLGAQLARHGKAAWHVSTSAFEEIVTLTERYNSMLDGKWRYMMDYKPRNLLVFMPVDTTPLSSHLHPKKGK